jgi:hypothetical protein
VLEKLNTLLKSGSEGGEQVMRNWILEKRLGGGMLDFWLAFLWCKDEGVEGWELLLLISGVVVDSTFLVDGFLMTANPG